jgi:choline dehydrogenase-like flavoprotein
MRCSTAVAYLRPAIERPNLTVITDALALRVLFDGERASGIEIARRGQLQQIAAEREVILCAGAYQSPQLLMLSGIGPADQLSRLQIDVRADLPVGEGLQDHQSDLLRKREARLQRTLHRTRVRHPTQPGDLIGGQALRKVELYLDVTRVRGRVILDSTSTATSGRSQSRARAYIPIIVETHAASIAGSSSCGDGALSPPPSRSGASVLIT